MTYLSGKRPYKDARHAPHILDACHRSHSIRVFGVQDKMLSYIVVREFQRGVVVGHMHNDTFGMASQTMFTVHTLQSASRNSTLERVQVDCDRFKATRAICESTVPVLLVCVHVSGMAGFVRDDPSDDLTYIHDINFRFSPEGGGHAATGKDEMKP